MKKVLALALALCLLLTAAVSLAAEEEGYFTTDNWSVKLPEGEWSRREGPDGITYFYPVTDKTGLSGAIMFMTMTQDIGTEVTDVMRNLVYDSMISGLASAAIDEKVDTEDSTLAGAASRWFTYHQDIAGLGRTLVIGHCVYIDDQVMAICFMSPSDDLDTARKHVQFMSENTVYTATPAPAEEPAAEPAAIPDEGGAAQDGRTVALPETTGAVSDKEILFRSVPWGSSVTEAAAQQEFINPEKFREWEYWYPAESFMFRESGSTLVNAAAGGYVNIYPRDLKVAGYDVNSMQIYFTYVPDAEGNLVRDTDHTAMIYAYYQLDVKDPVAAFEDLSGKLSGLYGDVTSTDHYDGYGYIVSDQLLWKGQNGTMVSLVLEDYPESKLTNLYIKYGTADADQQLLDAFKAVQKEEGQNAEGNTDGL